MILVTLGTQDKQFVRILKAIDKSINSGTIKDKVIVQAGHTKYKSKNMEILALIPMDRFEKLISECDFLITHGGIGSIVTGLKNNKKVIGVARLYKYREHENDHQLQIIDKFVKDGFILEYKENDNLDDILKQLKSFKPKKFKNDNKQIKKIIKDYINDNNTSLFRFCLPFIIIIFLFILI